MHVPYLKYICILCISISNTKVEVFSILNLYSNEFSKGILYLPFHIYFEKYFVFQVLEVLYFAQLYTHIRHLYEFICLGLVSQALPFTFSLFLMNIIFFFLLSINVANECIFGLKYGVFLKRMTEILTRRCIQLGLMFKR